MEVDAGREHEAVIGQGDAIGRQDATQLRFDGCHGLADHGDALGSQLVVVKLLRFDVAQARDHLVAQGAGR